MKSIILLFVLLFTAVVTPQQININRVEQMPNKPAPYLMRDWQNTALGYDSLVFNFNLTGQYLPLIFQYSNTVNYPSHPSFGLHTVVGTTAPFSGEAINVLPALVSASLNGVNKSNQNGRNFVLMAEEYFNKANGENIYLNHPSGSSGDDWWYETMPNVFFYQLNYLYPNTGDYQNQFYIVAERWLQAVTAMGGSAAPWHVPYMNYRAFNLKTMKPLTSGVPEPEAAGSIAWILYNAYLESNNDKYRIGTELALEFLNNWSSNPSYELQLPYGVYTAARMNAELGTNYNIQKLVNWCFDVGALRSWGSIVGNWGGYDVSGLIGEVSSNDYAFMMNTFQLAGALVPMVRYDDRFARAIGKWILNASNAARLFYPNYLPDDHQDSEEWAHIYDPHSYISHEAMRKTFNSISPYATGDAISGNWGATNLALYGSSHAGIFGAIIDTTDVEGILKLDLLKTDYYRDTAYPSFLIYNPYTENKVISFNVGVSQHNIYEAVSNAFISNNISGQTSISIPANSALIAVVTPAGGNITTSLNKRLYNGVVIDYNAGLSVANYPPRIKALSTPKTSLLLNESVKVYCTAEDREANPLTYTWSASQGTITGATDSVTYTAPSVPGTYIIRCMIDDNNGGKDTAEVQVSVFTFINDPPQIERIKADPRKINLGGSSLFTCIASDLNEDTLTFSWSVSAGTLAGSGASVTYTAPALAGNYYVYCIVADNHGGSVKDSLSLEVRDLSNMPVGQLVLYYPFTGNANDSSGNNLNGFLFQAQLVPDRFGRSNSAYHFDGVNDYIQTSNNSLLNFTNAITINFWMKPGEFYDREQYPISHGNWQNRWKISITEKKIRWTVKSSIGTKDLDSETILVKDSLYMVTCFYNGSDYEIYINGELDAFTSFSGTIAASPVDMMIAQALPGIYNYGFIGVLDDIRIFNYGLRPSAIQSYYDIPVSIKETADTFTPNSDQLYQNYPNPFNPSTEIKFGLTKASHVKLEIYNSLGERIKELINTYMTAGLHEVIWNAEGLSSGVYFYTLYTGSGTLTKKMIYIR